MGKGDFLYIGAGFSKQSPAELKKSYSDKKVFDWMAETGHALGLDDSDFDISVGYNHKKSAIELFLNMKKDKSVSSVEREVHFKAGDRIRAAISYHYPFEHLFDEAGRHFQISGGVVSGDKKYMLLLCEKE